MKIKHTHKLLLLLLLAAPSVTYAVCRTVKPSELALLPQYCQVKCKYGHDRNNPLVQRWARIFGWKNYNDIHHYCFAMNFENRAMTAPSRAERKFIYGQAVNNYDYVLKHWSPGFILVPEAHVRKGRVLEKLGKRAAAIQEYEAAIRANPKFVPAYAALSDWYKRYGQKKEAVAALERGLKAVPKSRLLQRRLARLR